MLDADKLDDLFGYLSRQKNDLRYISISESERFSAIEDLFLLNLRIELENSLKLTTLNRQNVILEYSKRIDDSRINTVFQNEERDYKQFLESRLNLTNKEEIYLEKRMLDYMFSLEKKQYGLEDIFFGFFFGKNGEFVLNYSLGDPLVRKSAVREIKTTNILLTSSMLDSSYVAVISDWLDRTLINGVKCQTSLLTKPEEIKKYQTYLTKNVLPNSAELEFILDK